MPDMGLSRWALMNPEKEELKLAQVAKRPTVIIATPLGSLSIKVAVGVSDSCGRWWGSRERVRKRERHNHGLYGDIIIYFAMQNLG